MSLKLTAVWALKFSRKIINFAFSSRIEEFPSVLSFNYRFNSLIKAWKETRHDVKMTRQMEIEGNVTRENVVELMRTAITVWRRLECLSRRNESGKCFRICLLATVCDARENCFPSSPHSLTWVKIASLIKCLFLSTTMPRLKRSTGDRALRWMHV